MIKADPDATEVLPFHEEEGTTELSATWGHRERQRSAVQEESSPRPGRAGAVTGTSSLQNSEKVDPLSKLPGG